MRSIEIDIKSNAMRLKLLRFTLESIAITGYYGDNIVAVAFIDRAGYVWHVSNCYGTLVLLECKTHEEKAWLDEVSKRSTTKDLHERYRAVLKEEIDYAIVFDLLLAMAKENGTLSLCKVSNVTVNERRVFDNFFTSADSPESIAVQYDLYACPIDKDAGI